MHFALRAVSRKHLHQYRCHQCATAPAETPSPRSGHHHQNDHGILDRQQRLGATTATGTIIRVAGQQSCQWKIWGVQLIQGADRVSVSHLLAVLDGTEHPAEADRGGEDHGSKTRGPPREGEPDTQIPSRIIRLTTPTPSEKTSSPSSTASSTPMRPSPPRP